MTSTSRIVAFLAVVALAACSDPTVEPASSIDVEAEPPNEAQLQPPSTSVARDVAAGGVPFHAEAASLEGNALVSTGKAGYLMYGPYVPLDAGKYRLTVRGEVEAMRDGSQLLIDVASKAGQVSHGEVNVSAPMPGQETIADIEFSLASAVPDLEIRAHVSDGAAVRIYSYQVVPAE